MRVFGATVKGIVSVLAFGLLAAATAPAATGAALPTRETVLKAVETFAESPTSPEGRVAAEIIVRFVTDSEEVVVVVSPKAIPWLQTSRKYPESATLVTAYLAGNAAAQLKSGVKGDDAYAGELLVLATYAKLQAADPALDIPEVHNLASLESRHELKPYLEGAAEKLKRVPAE